MRVNSCGRDGPAGGGTRPILVGRALLQAASPDAAFGGGTTYSPREDTRPTRLLLSGVSLMPRGAVNRSQPPLCRIDAVSTIP